MKLRMQLVPGLWAVFGCLAASAFLGGAAWGGENVERWKGQTVYVPVYSHVYSGDRDQEFDLTAMLSLRNTDPTATIRIIRADYYDSEGHLVAGYVKEPVRLKPLASSRYVIKESDRSGGSGANFIVTWEADSPCVQPIIETVMIGARMQQGISFICRGQVIAGQKR